MVANVFDPNVGFAQFLIRARKATSLGNGPTAPGSRPGSVEMRYSEGVWLYVDSFLGRADFIGQEIVWYYGKEVWGLNYYGRMFTKDLPQGFKEFLKEALRNIPEKFPFRGPELWVSDHFNYSCQSRGSIDRFEGVETVLWRREKIYELRFQGGMLR